ncbi:MAG: LamG domain-containing protein, partial [Candidatus Micrarchaeaceae archaeon]
STAPTFSNGGYFNGSIANIQLYNTNLTNSQIASIYATGISSPPVTSNNLAAWWPLNGNANDYSGNGNNGTLYGPVGFISTQGLSNINANASSILAARFNGVSSYISAPASSSTESAITVTFWIYPVPSPYWGISGNYWENAISGGGGCWNNYFFYIESGSNPPTESWSITNTSGTQYRLFPYKPLSPNTWQQLVGVYNGTYLTMYYDGQEIGTPVAAKGKVSFNGAVISGTNPPSVGAGCNPISGNLANIQIYNTALSASEIQALYQEGIAGAPISNAGLVGWWPLNGNANDYSGNGNNGTEYNVLFVQQQIVKPHLISSLGNFGNNFNGQWSSSPYNSNSVIVTSTPLSGRNYSFTIAMWVKPSSIQNFSHSWTTAVFSFSGYQAFGLQNSCLPNTCLVLHRCSSADTSSGTLLPYSIFNNRWYFVAVSVKYPNYYWQIDNANSTDTNTNGYGSSTAATIGTQFAQCDSNAFNGSIANVQIYNTALSAGQIQQLYQESTPPVAEVQIPLSWYP